MTQEDLYLIYTWTLPMDHPDWYYLDGDKVKRAGDLAEELCYALGLKHDFLDPETIKVLTNFLKKYNFKK